MFHITSIDEIKQFTDFLCYERQLTKGSITLYLSNIKDLKRFLGKSLLSVAREDISSFLVYLKNKYTNKNTIAHFVNVLRSFYEWASYRYPKKNLIAVYSFLRTIVKVKMERKIPFIPKQEEIKKLRYTLEEFKSFLSFDKTSPTYRKTLFTYTIFELLITSGMRSNELRNLRKCDIDLDNKILFIRCGKGDYQRLCMFGGTAVKLLTELLASKNYSENDLIFPIKQGNVLSYMIKRWAKRANIDPKIHIHSFRHYFITESQRQGVPMQIVADQVGHRSLNTTRLYTHFTGSFIQRAYAAINI